MIPEGLALILAGCAVYRSRKAALAYRSPLDFWQHAERASSSGDRSRIYQEIGAYLKIMGRPAEAEPVFRKALEMNPTLAPAMDNLAWILFDSGRGPEALELIRRCTEFRPGYAMGWLALGAMSEVYERRTLEEARGWYERALELDPRQHRGWNRLGLWHARHGDLEKAKECFSRAREMAPSVVEYTFNYGLMLFKLSEDKTEAQAVLTSLPQPVRITIESLNPAELGIEG